MCLQVVLFAVPGAFTPTCSKDHAPGFISHAEQLKAKGVDTIACISVNDPFVMEAWAKDLGAGQDMWGHRGQVRGALADAGLGQATGWQLGRCAMACCNVQEGGWPAADGNHMACFPNCMHIHLTNP